MSPAATTFYLAAYDIPSDRRRAKIHKLLSGFGQWTQFSVFELFLTDKELVILQNRLEKLLNPKEDSLRLYPLCAACLKEVRTIGSPAPQEPHVFFT